MQNHAAAMILHLAQAILHAGYLVEPIRGFVVTRPKLPLFGGNCILINNN